MDSFTCVCCHVVFKDGEIQRLHYKTDWHRYNLKRKVVELPPVTAEEFQRRVLLQRNENENLLQDKSVYCNFCRKTFGNDKSYTNHLNSKKHKEKSFTLEDTIGDNSIKIEKPNIHAINTQQQRIIEKMENYETDSEIEELDSDEWDEEVENPIDNNNCIFCLHHSKSLFSNIKHMSINHSFFIPDVEYCIDIKGLLQYLGEKINNDFICIWCNEKGRTFHSATAVRSHMIDKGHCKMLHDGLALAEYADYYDYSASYPDFNKEDVDKDSEVSITELDDSDYQLVLPSGAIIGHRSLMRYYKQSIDPNRSTTLSRNTKKLHKILAGYRALGWSITQQEAAAKKARDLHYMKRLQSKYNMKLGVKNNKLQKHFRQQVNF